eukprot:GHUV01045384.1.p2 GENE.GHUV01045384.1~~GHUV01045384.1.p2  ORF type:complete len:131 (-),score=26.04 GHUV01045384.1:320-712(-)
MLRACVYHSGSASEGLGCCCCRLGARVQQQSSRFYQASVKTAASTAEGIKRLALGEPVQVGSATAADYKWMQGMQNCGCRPRRLETIWPCTRTRVYLAAETHPCMSMSQLPASGAQRIPPTALTLANSCV